MITLTKSLRKALSAYGGRLGMRRLGVALLVVVLTLGAAPALAVDIHVDNGCSLANAIWSAMGRFQRGNAKNCETGSGNNDTIIVSGTLYFSRKLQQLRGNMTIKGVNNASLRTFGGHRGPIFHVSLGNVTIKDLILSNNHNEQNGGGALRQTGGNTILDNVTISDSEASDGGGIAVYRGAVTLRNGTSVQNNTANRGGGVFVGKNGRLNFAQVTSSNSRSIVQGNIAKLAGGGIYAQGRVNIKGNSTTGDPNAVHNNRAPHSAGIYTNATLVLDKASITSNVATDETPDGVRRGYGGGITVVSNQDFPNANVSIRNGSTISQNQAGYGGGFVLHKATLTFSGGVSTLGGNTAAKLGADIFAQHNSRISYGIQSVPAANVYIYNP